MLKITSGSIKKLALLTWDESGSLKLMQKSVLTFPGMVGFHSTSSLNEEKGAISPDVTCIKRYNC